MKFSVEVQNVDDYAKGYPYIVTTLSDGELWFYGAWKDRKTAENVVKELGSDNHMIVINEVAL